MRILSDVGANTETLAAEWLRRGANRQAADLLGCRQIAAQQRRREVGHRDVVEAVAQFIGRQPGRYVNVERQQIAYGVLIFRSIQPPEGGGASGTRLFLSGRIEC